MISYRSNNVSEPPVAKGRYDDMTIEEIKIEMARMNFILECLEKSRTARQVAYAGERYFVADSLNIERKAKMSWQFTVGLRVKGKADRIVVDAEDALIAALSVKAERPEATIMYVRRLNRRGDTRHPPHTLTGGR